MSAEHEEEIACLFAQEIAEVATGVVEIKAIARKLGSRTKVAVVSHDPQIDCIGACVGERGYHIRAIVEKLNGERIDLVRWSDALDKLIPNALQPAEILKVLSHPEQHRVTVVVNDDQLSLAVGRRGLNRELASRLCACEIEVMTPDQLQRS